MAAHDNNEPAAHRERVLLTLLGTGHSPCTYTGEGHRAVTAEFAAVGLAELLPEWSPTRLLVFVTEKSRKESLESFQEAAANVGLPLPEPRNLRDPHDLDITIADIVDAVPSSSEVRLDLTHGFRHLALLAGPVLAILEHTRDVSVVGVHYGMKGGPMFELTPLLELPLWLRAVRAAITRLATRELAGLLPDGPSSGKLKANLGQFEQAWRAGLPLEAGFSAEQLANDGRQLSRVLGRWPQANELRGRLLATLRELALDVGGGREGFKARVHFDAVEERRQFTIIQRQVADGQVAAAVSIAREWLVSKAIPHGADWLDKTQRRRAASRLNALVAQLQAGIPHPADAECLGKHWRELRDDLRNYVMHAGMRRQDNQKGLENPSVLDAIEKWYQQPLPLPAPMAGTHLIAPVGLAPGSVYTAIQRLNEAGHTLKAVLLVGSVDSLPLGEAALEAARFDGIVQRLGFADVFADYPTALGRVERIRQARTPEDGAVRAFLVGATEIIVNLAGGTTLLGVVAERLANEARSLGGTVRTIAVADRRPIHEQRDQPFEIGELHWVANPPNTKRPQ